jgi:hypothetical protein
MGKDEDFLKEIQDNYKEAVDGWSDIYKQASHDIKFVYDVDSGQWPEKIKADRAKDDRPVLTLNKLQKFIRQLRGDMKMNRPRMKVIPVDDRADVIKAELYNGLIRKIEYLSSAEIAYDTAYMYAISGSIGYFRITTDFSDDNSFEQDIFIKRIINPLSIHLDPYAVEFEMEDARYCFIEDMINQDDYKKRYPKSDIISFSSASKILLGDWLQHDKVRIAEYFKKESMLKKLVMLKTGEVIPVDNKMTIPAIKELGGEIVRERDVETYIIKWYKTNGVEILEESTWPGKYIPVIPVFGDEIVVDGQRHYLSLIRGAKDPQQMYNYWGTAATEAVALTPKMPFIVDHRQIQGFEREWEEAHRVNRMFIRYKAIAGLQKPSREPQSQIPSGIITMMQSTAFDIEDHLGRYESSKGEASNERSGKAIIARINQSDKGTYTFVDNLTRAIIYGGRQLIDLIPKIYDTPRTERIMNETGEETLVELNKPALGREGEIVIQNDLSVGKFDLIATTGASYGSKRQEMVDMMIQSMQYAPQLASVIAPLIFKYSDWPGADEIYGEIKKAIQSAQQPGAPGESPQP